jgi:hypothetical protein
VLILIGSQSSGDLYDSRSLYLLMVLSSCTAVAGRRSASAPQPHGSAATHPAIHGAT